MKLGFLTAIMADKTFEEVVDYASEQGFSCIEVACWPKEGAERRYAGVCHIDVETLTEADSVSIKNYCREKNVGISALAYYPNILSGDREMDARRKAHLYRVIDAAKMLGVGLVNTFIWKRPYKNCGGKSGNGTESLAGNFTVCCGQTDQDRNRKLPNAVWKRAVAGWGKFDDHTGDLEKDIPDASI